MTVGLVVAWLALVTLVGLNAAAAGLVALFHGWPKTMRAGARALLASAAAGFLPASAILGFAIAGSTDGEIGEGPMVLVLVFAVCQAVATLVSFPGALIAVRRLEAPGDTYRTFE